MPGTPCAEPVRTEIFTAVATLPADALALLEPTLFASPAWWDCVQTEAMPAGSTPCFLLCRIGGQPAALFVLCRAADGALGSLTTPYTCLYAPALAPGISAEAQAAALIALTRFCRRSAVTRLEALDPDAPSTAALAAAAMRAGLCVLRFAHFGNWHEAVAGQDWSAYLANRPGALRETIRRRLRHADRQAGAVLTVVDGPAGLEAGIAAYEAVYASSWKEPEPFPRFNAALMRALAPLGMLRLGVWRIAGQPVAAQFWAVDHGRATVLKLAHDEAFKPLSPGTVLTALMLRRLLEQDRVAAIDFGRGDDDYKQGWARARRQRIGLLLVNPWRPAGWPVLVRHALGRLAARWRQAGGISLAGGAGPPGR
ncbi:MAG: GNAT family N-acetyltransferase [Acetobacteraceae bacterium]|nr:GNAT family N-acetyltransferase [Acetobacteraceae bacterium]